MLRAKSPSTRAAQAAERESRLQRHQQRQQKQEEQQQQQRANKPATPPALRDELGVNHQSAKNNGSSITISNNGILASAVTPASPKGSRLSFGPLPQERYSIEGGQPSISFNSPSPPTPDDRRRSRSRSLAPPAPHSLQGEAASSADVSISTNGSGRSSCVAVDVDGTDTGADDDPAADTDKDQLLNSSTTSSIELVWELDEASSALPPQGEIFGSDSRDQKQQQQQQQQKQKQQQQKQQQQKQQQQRDGFTPIPFNRGSGGSNPDVAWFDFDVDEIDGLIGELADEPENQEKHEQSLAGKLCGPPKEQQQLLQEEQPPRQPPQQLQPQDYHHHHHQHDTQKDDGGGGQEEQGGGHQQQKRQPQPQQQQDKHSDEEKGEEASAIAAPAVATTFLGPAQAILADPVIQLAMGNAAAVAAKMDFMTKEANTHAAALAAQSQVEVGLAWQGVVSAMHTVAVSLKVDNNKLVASNAGLEAEKRGFIRKINSLENHVKMLTAQRDRLTAGLHEPWEASPSETSGNGSANDNGNFNGNECAIYDCTNPVGMSPGTPATSTTLGDRAVDLAAATSAGAAAFATPTAKSAIASGTRTVTGQPDSTMATAAIQAVMNIITAKAITTMAPQQCEVGLPSQTTPASVTLSSTAAPAATENPQTTNCPMPVASTVAVAAPTTAASTPTATAITTTTAITTGTSIPTATAASTATTTTAAAAAPTAPTATTAVVAPTAPTTTATAATPSSVRPKMVAGTPKHRSGKKTPGSTTGGRTPWVGGGVGGGVFASPPAVENSAEALLTPVALAARLENEMRQEDTKRTPLVSVRINTVLRSVPSSSGKGRKASPCVPIPTLGQAYMTMVAQSTKTATKPTATVAAKKIVSDDKGVTDENRKQSEGIYGRLRSASRPLKSDTKVVASGSKKVVAGPGVSSRSRQEAATNRGAAGGRSKAVPKHRWR